jgi:hypothetical protein
VQRRRKTLLKKLNELKEDGVDAFLMTTSVENPQKYHLGGSSELVERVAQQKPLIPADTSVIVIHDTELDEAGRNSKKDYHSIMERVRSVKGTQLANLRNVRIEQDITPEKNISTRCQGKKRKALSL